MGFEVVGGGEVAKRGFVLVGDATLVYLEKGREMAFRGVYLFRSARRRCGCLRSSCRSNGLVADHWKMANWCL